jgi:membrane protease YdiL (CAAX protease family)
VVRSWTVVDFILVWLGGFLGTGVLFAVGALLGGEEIGVVLALAGQYIGNLGVLWFLKRRKENGDLGFIVEPSDLVYLGLGLVLQIALALIFFPLTQLLFPDGQPPQQVAELMANADTSGLLKLTLIIAAVILAPIAEELAFRGVLLRAFEQRSKRFIIVVTAAAFAAVHVLGLDTANIWASAAVVLPPIFLLGLVLAWVTLRTERLGPAIFMHSGWNLLAAFVLLLPPELLESAG